MNDSASIDTSPATQARRADSTARPGCVSALVVLFGLRALTTINLDLYSIAPALIPHFPRTQASITDLTWDIGLVVAFDVILAALWLVSLWGLWRMRNWARVLLITVAAVNIGGQLVLFANALANHSVTGTLIAGLIIALVVGGAIFWWFIPRRKLFV